MTLIKFSPLVTAASGSMDGITFVSGKPGDYVRERTIPFNPNTEAQQAVRAIQSQLAKYWSETLTDAQRLLWDNDSLRKVEKNRVGTTIVLTPQALFTRFNFARIYPAQLHGDTLAPLDVPVLPLQLFPLNKVVVDEMTDTDITFSPTPEPNITKLNHYVIIKSSKVMRSGAVSQAPMAYRKVVSFATFGPPSYPWNYVEDIGAVEVGQRITFGVSYVNANTGAETATISQIVKRP